MKENWRTKGDPVDGSNVESWTRQDFDGSHRWVQVFAKVTYQDGEPIFRNEDVDTVTFHDDPPIETEGRRVWRYT